MDEGLRDVRTKDLRSRIFRMIVDDLYDKAVMDNLSRPDYVERMIALLLGDEWGVVSGNWGAWDLQNQAEVRIEVKQSARRQPHTSRASLEGRLTSGVFSIAPKELGYVEDARALIEKPGRYADLFVFAWHSEGDETKADHRDPSQWVFYVVPESRLKEGQKSISLANVEKLTQPVSAAGLKDRIGQTVSELRTFKKDAFPVPGFHAQ